MRKFHETRGETLIEVLASVLIAALSVTLLFSCVMTASRVDEDARALDGEHYNALSEAEAYTTAPDATPYPTASVTITRVDSAAPDPTPSITLPVDIYGGEGMYSYRGQP